MDKNSCALLEFFKSFKQPEPEKFARNWGSNSGRDEKNEPNTDLPLAEALMNSCCALASFALSQQADQNLDADQTYEICAKWLANFEFTLAEWNYARSIPFTVLKRCGDKTGLWYNGVSEKFDIPTKLVPATRNSILVCIYDILKFISLSAFDGGKKNYPPWLINPLDLRKFFMFSPESMRMNSFDLGASIVNRNVRREIEKETTENVNEQPAPQPAPRKKKAQSKKSFAKMAKSGRFEKNEIRGTNEGIQLGIKPVKIGLHIKILAGGETEKIVALLKKKRLKASNVKIINLSHGPRYSAYQVQLDVPFSKSNFWADDDFWPAGVYVRRWRGRLTRDLHDYYHRRLELSGIGRGITGGRVEEHLKTKTYSGIDFIGLQSSNVVGGKCVVDLKVRFDQKDKLVFSKSTFPDGVKGRWLRTKIETSKDWC